MRATPAALVLAGLFAALTFGTQAFAQDVAQQQRTPAQRGLEILRGGPPQAQSKPETQFAPGMPADQEFAMRSTIETRLAYVITGNTEVDAISKSGLQGLTLFLAQRTALEAGDPIGLDIIEQQYLHLLRESQGTLRLNVIASSLGLPRATLERSIEPFLIRAGLIQKDDAGRSLTDRGWQHVSPQAVVTGGSTVPPSEGA